MSKLLAMLMTKQQYMNLDIVGSPTISNGVVSGFSNSAYMTASKNVSLSSDDVLEVVLDLKMTSFNSNGLCFLSNNNNIRFQFYGTNDTYKQLNLGGESTYGTKQFLLNTYYQIKIVMTATTINMYYYENGVWILEKTYTGTFSNISSLCFGDRYTHTSGGYFSGEINFNNSYIKINGTKYIFIC